MPVKGDLSDATAFSRGSNCADFFLAVAGADAADIDEMFAAIYPRE